MNLVEDIKKWFGGAEKRAVPENWDGKLNSLEDWQELNFLAGGGKATRENAMALSCYWGAVRLISDSLASVPLKTFRSTSTGKSPAKDDYRYKLLKESPNDLQTSFQFRSCLVIDLLTTGNCYAIIHRIGRRIHSLEYVPAGHVAIERDGLKVRYKIREKEYKPSDMIHVAGMGFDGLKGFSPLEYAKDTIGIGLATSQFVIDYFKKGAVMSGILSTDTNLTPEQAAQLKTTWHEQAHGNNNNHTTKVVGGGLKYSRISNTPEESSLIDQRKFQIQEVARLFGIPLHLLGDLEKSSFNNIEVQGYEYVKYCLSPYAIRFEQEFKKKLFPEDDMFAEHNLDGFLRASSKDRGELYKVLFETGAITSNQIAKFENLPGHPDGNNYMRPDLTSTDKKQNGNTSKTAQ